ncbi:MAG: formyltransferase family protein [candidate division KSB1 bacterium]|nr:formyltransferase family protein [candidate division KSB1 bacterium]MDZ7366408.1 formyltransferase family protein [candidate division KSB1 bacterium]MDZ7404063.1 formyltransferase family protein [candidate division KSB1 bacterium]
MNIVVLCKSWNHKKVLEILAALRQQELRVRGIVALAPTKQTFSGLMHKARERAAARILQRFSLNGKTDFIKLNGTRPAGEFDRGLPNHLKNDHSQTTIAAYAELHEIEMVVVGDLNGDESVAALKRMSTDILLFGGVPIIRANVLAVPRVCALNVHMALLPGFRGMNVAEWSILSGAAVGVTFHQVDPGVDTGAILYRETIDVSDCPSLAAMRAKVSRQQHQVLAQCTRWLIEKKFSPEPQKKEDGRQFYLMHDKLKKIVEHKLSKGYKPRVIPASLAHC